ncbi:MAG: pLS20_p028 family conjugation system transmembrane protein [Anaerovoracaceae bacterium]
MSTEEILLAYKDMMEPSNLVFTGLRQMGFGIVKFLSYICTEANNGLDSVYNLISFANNSVVRDFIKTMMPVVWILFTVSIIFLGYIFLVKRDDHKMNIFQNAVIILLVLTIMPTFFNLMTKITLGGTHFVQGSYETASTNNVNRIGNTLIKNSINDTLYIDEKGFPKDRKDLGKGAYNKIPKEVVNTIEIAELVDPANTDVKNKEVFNNKIMYYPADDTKPKLMKIKGGMFDVFPTWYYRYNVEWLPLLGSLIALALVLVFTIFKIGRVIWELAFHQLFAYLVVVTDLGVGQRSKEIFKSIFALFAVFFLTTILLKFYFLFYEYISKEFQAGNLGIFIYTILIIISALTVIDGPNVIEKIIGVDAGIKSGFHVMMGAFAVSRAGASAANVVARGANNFGAAAGKFINDGNPNEKRDLTKASSEGVEVKGNKKENINEVNDKGPEKAAGKQSLQSEMEAKSGRKTDLSPYIMGNTDESIKNQQANEAIDREIVSSAKDRIKEAPAVNLTESFNKSNNYTASQSVGISPKPLETQRTQKAVPNLINAKKEFAPGGNKK